MKVETVLVAANPKKPHALELEREVEDFLLERGLKLDRNADLLVAIGGDGTVLYNVHAFPRTPIFGIGSERSFICQATSKNWKKKLEKVAKGKGKVEEKSMLDCFLHDATLLANNAADNSKASNSFDESNEWTTKTRSFCRSRRVNGVKVESCLNEVCVKGRGHRLLKFELKVGRRKFAFRADGIIFSTPTGSTAYAYSAGGKELKEGEEKYEIVAIAPYRRKFGFLVVGGKVESSLKIACDEEAMLVVDGLFEHAVSSGSVLRVKTSRNNAKFVKA